MTLPRAAWIFLAVLLIGIFAATALRRPSHPTASSIAQTSGSPAVRASLPRVLIVPHHDLVASQRADFFKQATATGLKPKTIILVSPNHYEVGSGAVQTSDQSWTTETGLIAPDKALITRLTGEGVTLEPGSFTNEHGIHTVLSNISASFPGATIVPLIVSTRATRPQMLALADTFSAACADCLLIASVDFSHYQPAVLGDLHDSLSLRALMNLDLDALEKKAEVDSPMSLVLAAGFAVKQNALQFTLQNHTSADVITGDVDGEGTTHIYGWYAPGPKIQPSASVSFLLGGDIMLDRSVADRYFFKNGGDFNAVLSKFSERTFWGGDLGMANLEGPISSGPVDNDVRPDNLVFNFPPQSISVPKALRLNALSLANNHSANAGAAGLANTRAVVTAAGITPVGGPADADTARVATIQGQGITLHVVTVLTLSSQPDLAPLIASLKKGPQDRVLVFPHWGVEYNTGHTDSQAAQAHSWIDAGADLVVGAHPHVVEDSELYKGVPIIYSLGNFIFDQWFSTETERGMLLGGEFTAQGLRLFGLPIGIDQARPYLLSGAEKQQRLERIYAPLKANLRPTEYGNELYFPTSPLTLEESKSNKQ